MGTAGSCCGSGGSAGRGMELLLDCFEHDVHDKAESAERAGGPVATTVEGGGGISKRGFHFRNVDDRRVEEAGEIGAIAIALDQQREQAMVVGRVEDLMEREIILGLGFNEMIEGEGEISIGTE